MVRGVGLIGAGPGTAALHVPTLARMPDEFELVHVSDAGSGRAQRLGQASGAVGSTGIDELLADPRVDVVVVCSPPDRHAQHVLAAVAAGKGAILCEKPLALTREDAHEVIRVCSDAGTRLLVGTNHLLDPAWGRATHHLVAGGARVRTLRVEVALPPNGRYHSVVTDIAQDAPRHPAPDLTSPDAAGMIVRRLLLGLGVHDLPIVRDLAHDLERVVYARPVAPIGYAVGFLAGGVLVQLNAVMLESGADAQWRIAIGTDSDEVEVRFRPAFTHDGGALVRVTAATGRATEYPRGELDGYVAEWRSLLALLEGAEAVEYDALLADALYAIDLADEAERVARQAVMG